jgi:TetR/AcrR family transcriptional regulator, acrAB operon repressor
VDVRAATIGLMSYIDGLLYNWLLQPDLFALERDAELYVDMYIAGLQGFPASKPVRAARRSALKV